MRRHTMRKITLVLALGALGPAFACASAPAPAVPMMRTHAAVRYAEIAGAGEDPAAAAHLALATDALVAAQRLVSDGDYEEAASVLDRAMADALLAQELAMLSDSRRRASEAHRRLSRLFDFASASIVERRSEDRVH